MMMVFGHKAFYTESALNMGTDFVDKQQVHLGTGLSVWPIDWNSFPDEKFRIWQSQVYMMYNNNSIMGNDILVWSLAWQLQCVRLTLLLPTMHANILMLTRHPSSVWQVVQVKLHCTEASRTKHEYGKDPGNLYYQMVQDTIISAFQFIQEHLQA